MGAQREAAILLGVAVSEEDFAVEYWLARQRVQL